jgi:hypothetical protein
LNKFFTDYYGKYVYHITSNVKHLLKFKIPDIIFICPIKCIKGRLVKYLNKFKNTRKILFNVDEILIKPGIFQKSFNNAKSIKNLIIWEFSKLNINFLTKNFIKDNIKFVPFCLTYDNFELNKTKSIDVLFYGKLNNKRLDLYNKLLDKNINAVFEKSLSGKKKDELLSKTKIAIVVSRFDTEKYKIISNDLCRLSYLVDNNIFTITEYCNENELYEGITILTEYNNFLATIEECLKLSDKERYEIAVLNKENYYKKYNMKNIITKEYIDKLIKNN